MKVLVAIHDVSPVHATAVERLWEMCRARNVHPALLVVPNWHGDWPLEESLPFVNWVRARAAAGSEIFLHGERHDEVGSPRAWIDEWRAIGRTDREGEFLTLDAPRTAERIARGLGRLRALGLSPIGFVAPAWLARRECAPVAGRLGLAFSEDARAVYLHRRGMRLDSPVVRWSARTSWRAYASVAAAAMAERLHRRHWLVRLALHPQDLAHPATTRSIEDALDHWIHARIPWSYAAL